MFIRTILNHSTNYTIFLKTSQFPRQVVSKFTTDCSSFSKNLEKEKVLHSALSYRGQNTVNAFKKIQHITLRGSAMTQLTV